MTGKIQVKKDDIINTALNLFNLYSYNSVGVDRIISESGVAKMTFYKYFPSKAKLIEECLNRRSMNLQGALNTAISECEEHDYLAHIRTVFYWYHAWFHADDFNGCMFQKAIEEVSKTYPATMQPAIDYKAWLVKRLSVALNGLGVHQEYQLASLLSNLLDGMTVQAQIDADSVQIDACWKRVEQLIQLELMSHSQHVSVAACTA